MAKWSSASKFMSDTKGKYIDMDRAFGCQCWDYGDYFWVNQVGRTLQTGNGCAYGCWTKKKKENAGKEFTLITNKKDLKAGDWVIWNKSKSMPYGHIAMVNAVTSKGAIIKAQGANQGAKNGVVNVISISLSGFLGAFRYNYPSSKKKSNTDIAKEVIAGKWGNGNTRKKNLEKAGYNYNEIQKLVNKMVK